MKNMILTCCIIQYPATKCVRMVRVMCRHHHNRPGSTWVYNLFFFWKITNEKFTNLYIPNMLYHLFFSERIKESQKNLTIPFLKRQKRFIMIKTKIKQQLRAYIQNTQISTNKDEKECKYINNISLHLYISRSQMPSTHIVSHFIKPTTVYIERKTEIKFNTNRFIATSCDK